MSVQANTYTQQIWFMVASDTAATFRWAHILESQGSTFWWVRRLPRNFRKAWDGDLVLCYRSGTVERGLVGLAVVEEGFNGDGITVRGRQPFKQMIPFDEFKNEPVYRTTEAGRLRNRGTLFAVDHEFAMWIRQRLLECGDLHAARLLSNVETS